MLVAYLTTEIKVIVLVANPTDEGMTMKAGMLCGVSVPV